MVRLWLQACHDLEQLEMSFGGHVVISVVPRPILGGLAASGVRSWGAGMAKFGDASPVQEFSDSDWWPDQS